MSARLIDAIINRKAWMYTRGIIPLAQIIYNVVENLIDYINEIFIMIFNAFNEKSKSLLHLSSFIC